MKSRIFLKTHHRIIITKLNQLQILKKQINFAQSVVNILMGKKSFVPHVGIKEI